MIVFYIGGIGSGKTIRAVRELTNGAKDKNRISFVNFEVSKKLRNVHRLKWSDIIKEDDEGEEVINWQFWEDMRSKYTNFSIFLDEAHSIIHSRSAMTKRNKLMTVWVSQIRKILNDSPDNHLYIITQKVRRVDVAFRDLADLFVLNQKIQLFNATFIIGYYFNTIEEYEMNLPFFKDYFYANPYFNYYDTKKLVKFGETEYV